MAALAAFGLTASAQQKGEQSVSLYFGYDTGGSRSEFSADSIYDTMWNTETETREGDNLSVGFEYSYFVAKNLRLSATVSYSYQGNRHTGISAHAISICPGIAYYVRLAPGFHYTPNLNIGFAGGILDSTFIPGAGAEIQPLAVEFRPSDRFAMSVSLCSLQGLAINGKYNDNVDISAKGYSLDLIADAQIGFRLYF